jgi:hypothetical protein
VIVARLLGDDKVLARLRAMPADINSGLARAITKLTIDLQRNIQQAKLAGEVLAVRSGSLKSSIDVQMDERPTGIAATVFSDSNYAHAHEFGFTGRTAVRWISQSALFCARRSRKFRRRFETKSIWYCMTRRRNDAQGVLVISQIRGSTRLLSFFGIPLQ